MEQAETLGNARPGSLTGRASHEEGFFRVIAVRHLSRRFVAILTVALCAVVAGGIARTAIVPDREQSLLPLNRWYCLESSAGDATCQLPAGSGRYTLVIGCLADAVGSHQVRIKLTDELSEESSVRLTTPIYGDTHQAESSTFCEMVTHELRAPQTKSARSSKADVTAIGTTREFFIHVTDGDLNDPQQYARMTAQCVGEGHRVRVFVDQQLGANGIRDSQVDDLIHLLEADVLPRVEAQFGLLVDVDQDGRFAIVISPWLSRLQGGRVSINGMVRNTDFRRDVTPPFGNQCDMLLLNSALPCDAALRDLLSHEIAHAACISQRIKQLPQGIGDEHDWVSEGLAHLAEPTSTNFAERITTFLNDPSQYPLVIPDYYRAGLWRDPGCRGATVLFSKWCAEKYGPDLCCRLAQSPESGCRSFEHATSKRFEDLFRQWSISLAARAQRIELQSTSRFDQGRNESRVAIQQPLWESNKSELSLAIRGTAFAVVELPTANPHSMTLRINGAATAHWQYSIQHRPAVSVRNAIE